MWQWNRKKKKGNPMNMEEAEKILNELDEKDVEWLFENIELTEKDIRRLERYAKQRS